MKVNWKLLIINLAIPLAAGGIAAALSGSMSEMYAVMNKPPLSPPGWVFPVVWTVLYVLMGISSYLVATADAPDITKFQAFCLYGLQLVFNVLWPIVFFRWQMYLTAFFVLILLWIFIFITFWLFSAIRSRAGTLLLPYLLWVTFAGYLNYGVFLLN